MYKQTFLSLAVLFTINVSIGQSLTLINKTTSDKNSRILYVGLDNRLEVQDENFTGIAPKEYVTLQQNQLIVRPARSGQLTITFITTKGKIPVGFTVKPVSDAIIAISGKTDKVINRDSLLRKAQLSLEQADNKDSFFDHYQVVSFTAQLQGQIFNINGKYFSNELLTAIQNAQKGDVLNISEVKGLNEALSMPVKFNKTYSFEIE